MSDIKALHDQAAQKAEADADWWEEQWLAFPTVTQDESGTWIYWQVPDDSGVYGDDWAKGQGLARDTVAHMQRFGEGSTVLRRIMSEIDLSSTIAQGFMTRIEDMLTRPEIYLDDLEPGAVRAKLRGEN
ncbi:MAG: hypothetical protein AAF530_14560 [Pseudomonadota bacterium]